MSENINNEDDTLNAKPLPLWAFFIIFLYGTAIFAVLIILPSGDMGWIEGWAYILLFMGLNITYYIRINKKNPAVIRNRMKFKK
ncbi:MAG: hypothetical protein GY870_05350, partial [archaeon]|nr:hypothetical protein [archaeon]